MSYPSEDQAALAVVVGSGLNALGVVRSLARGHVPIVIVGPGSGCAMRSRFGAKLPLLETDGKPLIAALKDVASKASERPVLFLTEEKSVETVSERRSDLDRLFHIRLPRHETLEALLDKTEFQRLAQSTGCRIPSGAPLRSPADLDAVSKLRFPSVLKPASKNYAYGARFSKAYVVASVEEVERLYREIAPVMPDMIVQEWIDGEDSDIYFCLQYIGRNGELVASFVGRKLRSWPPRIGGTASCIAAPDHARELTDATSQFFRAVQFQGMASMEFKRDRRDGQFYMVEPTVGRTDFQEEVATINGVNIPLAAYRHEVGDPPVRAVTVSPPRLWREPAIDRWAQEGQERPSIESSIRHRAVDAYFRVNDPGPWLDNVKHRFRGKLQAMLRKIITKRQHSPNS